MSFDLIAESAEMYTYLQGASLRGRSARSERSMVIRASWWLANAKSSMFHENNPDAECMDEIERTERKSSLQGTSHQLSCFVNGYNGSIFLLAGQILFLRSF